MKSPMNHPIGSLRIDTSRHYKPPPEPQPGDSGMEFESDVFLFFGGGLGETYEKRYEQKIDQQNRRFARISDLRGFHRKKL